MPSIPTLKSKSQRQVYLSEFKASQVYRKSSRMARNTHRETTVSKYKNKKKEKGNIQPLLYYLLHSDSIAK